MTILYTVQPDGFLDIKNSKIIDTIYVNITNHCHCSCTFCVRNNEVAGDEDSLWLGKDPTAEEVIREFENINNCNEVVFCGFGEPLEKIDDVIEVSKYLKNRNPRIKIRVNTNGLGNLVHNKDITPMLEGLVDTISISLNAASKERYLELTNSKFGINSWESMLDFTKKCKGYVPNIVLTVVDVISREEIDKCRKICEDIGVDFRIRHKF